MVSRPPDNAKEVLQKLSPDERIRVGELVDQCELAQDEGLQISPEQLCAEEPELLEAVTVSLRELASTDQRLRMIGVSDHPKQIGEFEVLEQIGVGGSGVVFRCQQKDPNRLVAVKVFKPTLDVDEQEKRYRREIRVFESISAAGLADVFVSGITIWNGVRCFWIAMKLLDGGRIDAYAATHQYSQQTILQKFRSICTTLLAAHRQGIVHRDLKPSNILMSEDGEPHIVDFGIAAIAIDSGHELTETIEAIAGTAAWMAPEVALGTICASDIRSDIYSLGVVLFQLLAGKHPLGSGKLSLARVTELARDQQQPVRLSQSMEGVSPDLDTFVSRLIDPDPDYRYQNLDDVIADTDRLLNDEPVKIRSVSIPEKAWRWCRQNTALAVLSFLAITTASVALAVYFSSALRVQQYADRLFDANKDLQQRTADLEHTLGQQQRSIVNARLGNVAEHLRTNPREAELRLNDAAQFPPSMRSFGWRLLNFQSQSDFQCLWCAETAIRSISFSHSDALVATHSNTGGLQLTDVVSGKRLWEASGLATKRRGKLVFSPDDQHLYCIAEQSGIRKYDVASGELVDTLLPEISLRPGVLDLSEDGRWIVALSFKNKMVLVDSTSGDIRERQLDPDQKFKSLWMQNEGQIIVALTFDGTSHSWLVPSLSHHRSNDLAAQYFGFSDINYGTGSLKMGDGAVHAAICRNADVLAIRFDAKPEPVVRLFGAHGEPTEAICLVPPFSILVTTQSRTRISSLYGDSNTIFYEDGKKSRSNAVTSDGKRIAIGDTDGGIRIYTLDLPSARRKAISVTDGWPLHNYGVPISVVATADGGRLFIGDNHGFVVEVNSVTERVVTVTKANTVSVPSLTLAPSGEWLACAANGTDGESCVSVYRIDDQHEAAEPTELQQIARVKMRRVRVVTSSDDGQFLYAASRDGEIFVLDTESWTIVNQWQAYDRGVYSLTASGPQIFSGGGDGSVKLWSRDGRLVREWQAHDKRVTGIALSPDAQRLYTASRDQTAAIWTTNGQLVRRLIGHAAPVRAIAVSSDRQTIATAGEDYVIHLWDAQTGDPQFALRGHSNAVGCLQFTPLGLLSTSHDLTTSIWGVPVPDDSNSQ